MKRALASVLFSVAVATAAAPASAGDAQIATDPPRSHLSVAQRVASMISDAAARRLVSARGLDLVNVMWEDTGRYLGSSVGPNISDVTIEVEAEERGRKQRFLMPVIRFPNFSDKTADVKLDRFFVRVGNHRKGGALETVSLRKLLARPGDYMSLPRNGRIKDGTLLAERDQHALVSAQSAFLPIPKQGNATFWPVIFNYQSYADNPAVLTILVTRQGTSMTIVDNSRDTVGGGGSWGQRLYFNSAGERAPLTAERLADVRDRGVTANGEDAASLGEDANVLMLIQVPLKVKQQRAKMAYGAMAGDGAPMAAPSAEGAVMTRRSSDVDVAVLGHGPTEGPYTELDGLTIERAPRFPVRVTVQFYQATSNGVVDTDDVARMAGQIARVYEQGDYVGSLVTPAPGDPVRPTRWTGTSAAPEGLSWWDFPALVERQRRYGGAWYPWYLSTRW